jgi:hypothetical protein
MPKFDRKDCFHTKITPQSGKASGPSVAIGIWRSCKDFTKSAHDTGGDIQFLYMPAGFYQILCRYDMTLFRDRINP